MGKHNKPEPPPRLRIDGKHIYIEFFEHVEATNYAVELNAAARGMGHVFHTEEMPDKAA